MKKFYFINDYDTKPINIQCKKTFIIYRNYKNELNLSKLLKLKNFCKKKGNPFLISNNIKLAIKLNLDGVYIPSFNKNLCHLSYNFKKRFLIIGSAHNKKEVNVKINQKAKYIFISSIFKKNQNYLGLTKFRLLTSDLNIPVIALGGVLSKNLNQLRLTKSKGFAGITFFNLKN